MGKVTASVPDLGNTLTALLWSLSEAWQRDQQPWWTVPAKVQS